MSRAIQGTGVISAVTQRRAAAELCVTLRAAALRPQLHARGVNRWWRTAAASSLLVILAGTPAGRAAEMRWEGTLGFDFLAPGLPALAVTGTGVATLNGSGGGSHLSALRLAGGLSASALVPVTDPEVTAAEGIVALRASAALGSGSLAPFGSGPFTRSTLPVRGMLAVCLLDPACLPGGFIGIPLSTGDGAAGLGVGGTLILGTRISVLGAPWTLGAALLTVTTEGGATLEVPATGWVHGALSFTTSTALAGGALSLVTPLRVSSESAPPVAGFARLTLRFVPEPERALTLAAGAALLAVLGRSRRRS